MELFESGQDYLEAILILSNEKEVKSIDVANFLKVTKQSTYRFIKAFKKDGYINMDEKTSSISLTPKGLKIAKKVYERHVVLTKFLESIGVSKENANKDSCKIEHDLSEESFQAIKKLVK